MVMPLWDGDPRKRPKWPLVTWALLVANILAFIVQSAASPGLSAAFDAYAMTPAAVTGTLIVSNGPSPYLTLISSTFLHADIFHLLGNMIFLWVFGDDVEEAMGPLRYLVFYFAALAFVAAAPHSTIPLIGASGAIAGVLAGYLMFRPCQKVMVFIPYFLLWFVLRPVARLDAFWVLGSWAVIQLWHVSVQSHDGVAYMAHVGGFAAGAILFPLLRYRTIRLFECIRAEAAP